MPPAPLADEAALDTSRVLHDLAAIRRRNPQRLEMGVETDKYGSQANKGVKGCHELGHFGHLHAARNEMPEESPACHHERNDKPIADARTKYGCNRSQGHSDNAIPDSAFGALLSRKPAE
jgi:hypothetical protein